MAEACPNCGFRRFGNQLTTEREAANIREWAESHRLLLVQGHLLKPDQVATYTGRHIRTVRRWLAGPLESVSIRGRKFVTVDSLAGFIVECLEEK